MSFLEIRHAYNHVLIIGAESAGVGHDINSQIQELLTFRFSPILVVGKKGSDFLRRTPAAQELHLVFTPEAHTFVGAAKAGLREVNRPCFFFSYFATEISPADSLRQLKDEAGFYHPHMEPAPEGHLLGNQGVGWITRQGVTLLKSLPSESDVWQFSSLKLSDFQGSQRS